MSTKATHVRRLFALVVAVLVVYAAWSFFGIGHSIANGADIYARVEWVGLAVPNGATNVRQSSSAASWIEGCSEIPGSRSGWTTDELSVGFSDLESKSTVVASIDSRMHAMGWTRHDSSPGPHRGSVAHWTLNVNSDHLAQAWAFPVGPGTDHWYLSANWTPPGPRGQGCP